MRNWRVLTAIAAVVLAALAGVLVWKYTENAKDDAKAPYTFQSVIVAKNRIPVGTSFSAALDGDQMARQDRVKNDLPQATITGTSTNVQLKGTYGTLVASHDIAPGQTIVDSDFVNQGTIQSSLAGGLETDNKNRKAGTDDLQAITVTLDDTHAVGGFLSPGDTVNVILTGDLTDKAAKDTATLKVSAYLIPGLKVIAVGNATTAPQVSSTQSSTSSSSGSSSSSDDTATKRARSLVTFEVTPRQALQIAQAQNMGGIYLTLNPSSFKVGNFKNPGEIVEAINLFDPGLDITFAREQLAKVNAAIAAAQQ